MLKWNLKATAMPWERPTPTVVDRHSGKKIPWVVDKFTVADKSLVVEKSLLVDHSKWTLMFEMIKGMQQNQVELAESLRQLREANGNKEDHQNKNDNRNHEERESHNKNDTPFVTMSDVEPYPEKYDTPVFALFDGRKGSAMEHISKFLDSMGPFAAHGDLCLREFSKSLVDRAYTWYTVLPAGSIRTWEDMVESFCSKYFHVEEKITLVNLHSTKQQTGEDLVKYIHRFRDVSLDCHVKYQEGELVEVCIDNMLPEFRAHLENLDITRFAPLLQKARKTAISVKPQVEKSRDKKSLPADSHCVHRNRTQRWEVNRKIQNGTLLLSEEQQKVHQTPFPNYNKGKGKAVVSVVIHGNVSDMEAEESAAASSSLVPAAVRTLQKSPKFKSLFNQLGFGPEARNAATEALITIAAESGATCFTAEAHASRAFLETTNAITFTDEDMEVQYPDHRRPLYLSAVIKDVQVRRALVDTGSCLNLIPLSTLPSYQSATPEDPRARPWNERRKGKSVKLNMGVHHNACVSNSPMDASSIAYEAMSSEEVTVDHARSMVMNPQVVAVDQTRSMAANTKKAAEDQTESTTTNPEGSTVDHSRSTVMNSEEEDAVDQTEPTARKRKESTTAEPNLTSKEELEVINLSNDPNVSKPISISKSLSAKERKCLIDLLHEYKDVFAWDYHEMPGIDPGLVAHSLNVEPGTRPVVQPMRTFHTEVEAQITQEVKKLLAAGFIKPIQHPRWLSNIVPVKKKNGQIRCCVDFRNLNKACPKDEFPLPNMDLLIDSAAGHAMFSFMDGFSGYNQIRMTMTAMFHDMMHKEIEDYVDDIVVKSKKREDHLRILRKFLGFLVHNRGIDVDPAKASAIATMKAPTSHKELKSFLGRLSYIRRFIPGLAAVTAIFMPFDEERIPGRPLRLYLASNSEAIGGLVAQEDEDGTEKPIYYVSRALRDAETRYSGAERACLALIYASQRLRHYFLAHKIQLITKSHPIRSLLHRPVLSGRLAQWLLQLSQYEITTETPTAIKSQAIVDLLAQFPGEDSSSISHQVPGEIGEVLLAGLVDSTWTLKFDGSSTSNSSGAEIVLMREDGETIAKSFKLDFSCSNNASEYEAYITGLVIAHEMGIKHLRVIGDSNLIICQTKGSKVDVTIDKRSMPITDLLREKFKEQNLDAEDWRIPIKTKLILPGGVLARCVNLQEAAKKLIEVHEKCCELRDGVSLYRRLQRLGYFWPSMSKEAASLQEQCSFCQHQHESDQIYATFVSSDWRTPFLEYLIENILPQTSQAAIRIKKLATSLQNMATPWPFHTWGLDLIGPINPSSSGYIWILVATEYFSKWVEAVPLRKATGAAVANFIREHIIIRFGIPHKIISDNGTSFVNKNVREVLEHYRIKHRRSTPYYPQGNGQAEATNRMLLRILSKMVFDYGKGWSSHLADTLWAYRGSTKTATGFTPFSLVYGTDAISPTELLVPSPRILHGMDLEADADICAEARVADLESLEEARELAQVRSLRYHQKLADAYEKTLQTRIFAKGQMVLRTVDHVRRGLPSPSKFAPNWEGPYLIREAYDSGYYKLSTADGTTLVDPINGKWLKRYYS
uniref:Integrase catalytic domain-containing protein n=1 Tax=Fagus sylvatica TaxID=28930 RepID=A0A2N9FI93_FAGSY